MKTIGITGASGLLGRAIAEAVTGAGHRVVLYSRSPTDAQIRAYAEPMDLSGLDALIHLAGEPIVGRWTAAKRDRILTSREDGTAMVARAIREAEHPPGVLVCASGANFYGDRGDELLDESATSGEGFLAEVVARWEAAAQEASGDGTRVVMMRLGMVLSDRGGAGQLLHRLFRLGLGGRVGSGRQWMSWIHIRDAANLFLHAVGEDYLAGPVNAVSPTPATNAEFTRAMAGTTRRPAILPAPAAALRLVLGDMADLALHSVRAIPEKATASGFDFAYPELREALADLF